MDLVKAEFRWSGALQGLNVLLPIDFNIMKFHDFFDDLNE